MHPLAIFLGGGFGALARFMLASAVGRHMGSGFPWGTLAVNLLGALLIGILAELLALKFSATPLLRNLLVVGFLGGFTTFSAFSLESALMLTRGDYLHLVSYVLLSVVGTIAIVILTQHTLRAFI